MIHHRSQVIRIDNSATDTPSAHRSRFVESAKSELKQLEDQLTNIREQINALQAERKRVASLAYSLRSYLRTQTGDDAYAESTTLDDAPDLDQAEALDGSAGPSGPKSHVADAAYAILDDLDGKDLHYHDLTDRVIARIGQFASSIASCRTQLNTALNRDIRFLRPYRRGHYALRKDHPKAANVGSRKGRRRRG